jgi:hypothetical protein
MGAKLQRVSASSTNSDRGRFSRGFGQPCRPRERSFGLAHHGTNVRAYERTRLRVKWTVKSRAFGAASSALGRK